ncbi:MAG: hypothetical protein IMX02_10250 [Limnochordaceae bacterium]|nr:hypothetical protein [Limnochordaceae bacterium]
MPKSVREKISQAKPGKPLSAETRRKISEARRAYLARQQSKPPVESPEPALPDVEKALRELADLWKTAGARLAGG